MTYESMIVETIKINGHNSDAINAYTARPMGKGPFPGVVLIHHLPGWDETYREFTRRFAHHGYAAISHNLYDRIVMDRQTMWQRRHAQREAFPMIKWLVTRKAQCIGCGLNLGAMEKLV